MDNKTGYLFMLQPRRIGKSFLFKCLLDGMEKFNNGGHEHDCPYPFGSKHAEHWMKGFNAARLTGN